MTLTAVMTTSNQKDEIFYEIYAEPFALRFNKKVESYDGTFEN